MHARTCFLSLLDSHFSHVLQGTQNWFHTKTGEASYRRKDSRIRVLLTSNAYMPESGWGGGRRRGRRRGQRGASGVGSREGRLPDAHRPISAHSTTTHQPALLRQLHERKVGDTKGRGVEGGWGGRQDRSPDTQGP